YVVDGNGEGFQRVLVGVLLLDQLQGAVDDALCNCLLAAFHDHVHEFGQLDVAELRIRQDFTFGDFATTWHFSPLSLLQLAPLQAPREPSGLPLTRPAQNTCVWGHYAASPRHAAGSTEMSLQKSAGLTWPWASWRRT